MEPVETILTTTCWPGGNPAFVSQRPLSRMPADTLPRQGSPSGSIFRVRLPMNGEERPALESPCRSRTLIYCIVCCFQHTGKCGKEITVLIGTVVMPLDNLLGAFALHIEAVNSNALLTTVPCPGPVGKVATTGDLFPMLF